uniref:Uncharacterized protein n=1 Tax=Chromera velia CCMP2878 TaxID=1169474 RepID=A0A0G4I9U5_9ALVE|eukprot:Cvel_12270.t1-p1 / transcript=Cvel_12270.t1 / gene=Cvel_12270 / organism=Chromera_velia_CCMP2878 / gene_product=hypothetical protein / transcript_product=hypothetical protein / location=Cvel_scaffold795:44035-44754(+) / protein_length=89 / sequence_SO=supercontig / SO=protein_coding / is_pseudo=false
MDVRMYEGLGRLHDEEVRADPTAKDTKEVDTNLYGTAAQGPGEEHQSSAEAEEESFGGLLIREGGACASAAAEGKGAGTVLQDQQQQVF